MRIPIPHYYDIKAWTVAEAAKFLDVKHELGWRVVQMVPQPRSQKIIFLFEKTAAAK